MKHSDLDSWTTASDIEKSEYRDEFGKELSSLPRKGYLGKEFY